MPKAAFCYVASNTGKKDIILVNWY